MVVRRSDTRTPSKPPLKTSTYHLSHGNRLHKIVQSGEASKKGELVNTKQKESAKPSRNGHSGKPELRHHQQSFLPQTSLVLSATGSLELRLVSSAILEHTNNNTSHSWLGLVIVSNDRRTRFATMQTIGQTIGQCYLHKRHIHIVMQECKL